MFVRSSLANKPRWGSRITSKSPRASLRLPWAIESVPLGRLFHDTEFVDRRLAIGLTGLQNSCRERRLVWCIRMVLRFETESTVLVKAAASWLSVEKASSGLTTSLSLNPSPVASPVRRGACCEPDMEGRSPPTRSCPLSGLSRTPQASISLTAKNSNQKPQTKQIVSRI